ncbi:hypothetical protein BH11MYX1_BH11MYX1_39130 [soil metagenome]
MKHLVVVVGVVALAGAGWRWHSQPSADVGMKDGGKLVADRLWIDHRPRNDRDRFDVFAVLTRDKLTFFEKRSRWLLGMELGTYELARTELRVVFPQTGAKETYKLIADKCHTDGFDYCLEMSGGTHGAKRYFSMKNWVFPPGSDMRSIDAVVESITP